MAEPFLAEIRLFPYDGIPSGWSECQGQLLAINQNQALFALLGTTYGGDGRVTFGLPDLRGRVAVHEGNGVVRGMTFGAQTHALSSSEVPLHSHALFASGEPATADIPAGAAFATTNGPKPYVDRANWGQLRPMAAATAAAVGRDSHENRQPYLALVFAMAVSGIFPGRA